MVALKKLKRVAKGRQTFNHSLLLGVNIKFAEGGRGGGGGNLGGERRKKLEEEEKARKESFALSSLTLKSRSWLSHSQSPAPLL